MKRPVQPLLFALVTFLLISACSTVPITGRRQFLLTTEEQEMALGLEAYEQVKAESPPSRNQKYITVAKRVADRISMVTKKDIFEWEIIVVASAVPNAFCLPGGKMMVNEGIFPVCANEAGLACVIGHEVAHAIARHGGERMSQNMAKEVVLGMVDAGISGQSEETRQLTQAALGMGAQVGFMLPYSRKHESEADHMGLMYMAEAGYDPAEGPRFWRRFGEMTAGAEKPPEFLSTHPADETRAADLQELLKKARKVYEKAPQKYGIGESLR
jgi:predicted Zn-dependent protease